MRALPWRNSAPCSLYRSIGEDIKAVEFNWPLGFPLVKKLESDLWEVRSTLPGGIARTFFTVGEDCMVLLHGFIKKTQKTPLDELALARKRCKDVHRGGIEP